MAERMTKPVADTNPDRPDIQVLRRRENGSTIKLYDVYSVIVKGTFQTTISARKFAGQVCDGPAHAEVSTYSDVDCIPMCKIEVFAAPREPSDRPLSVLRFRKDLVVISRTVYSKAASFATLAEDNGDLPDQVFGSFP